MAKKLKMVEVPWENDCSVATLLEFCKTHGLDPEDAHAVMESNSYGHEYASCDVTLVYYK